MVSADPAAQQPRTWQRLVESYASRVDAELHKCGPPSWPSLLAGDEDVARAHAILRASAAATTAADPRDLERARRLLAASAHPDTGEAIPRLFRMAAHVPVNTILLLAMLSSTSVAGTAAAQLANSAFNAAQFYANRNRSGAALPDSQVAASFCGATLAAVAVGVAARRAAQRLELAPALAAPGAAAWAVSRARLASVAVPFLAAAAGKPVQIGLMRADELVSGVVVADDDLDVRGGLGARSRMAAVEEPPVGVSVVAGRAAVAMTVATRIIYLAPMLWLPFLHGAVVRALGLGTRSSAAALVALTALSSAYATPLCMALFDQRASLPLQWLEPGVREAAEARRASAAARPDLAPLTQLYFNKGV